MDLDEEVVLKVELCNNKCFPFHKRGERMVLNSTHQHAHRVGQHG